METMENIFLWIKINKKRNTSQYFFLIYGRACAIFITTSGMKNKKKAEKHRFTLLYQTSVFSTILYPTNKIIVIYILIYTS